MYHVLTHRVLGGKYSKWIVILQEFDLEFTKSKAKKSLVFAELIYDLPCAHEESNLEILSSMKLFSSSAHLILGMETSSFTSKPNAFSLTLPVKSIDVFATIRVVTLSSVTPCITVVLILSFDDV